MSYHVHQIDGNKHREFLAEQRIDPVMQQLFRAGDKVVFCAICKGAFLEDSWLFREEKDCGQSNTLSTIPLRRSNQRFSKKKIRPDNISAEAQPTGTPGGTRAAAPFGTPVVPPPISEPSPVRAFSMNTSSIRLGQSITLSWDVAAKYAVSINKGIGSVLNTGVRTITPGVWYWGWLWLRNKRQVAYVLTAEGPSGTFRNKLQIDLTLPALPVAISSTIQLARHSVILSGSSPLRQLNTPLGQAAMLLNHNRLRTFFRLKQNQIKLGDYAALIMPPKIIRNLSTMPFYQRIPVGFFRRFKQRANTA